MADEFLHENGHDVTDKFVEYLQPLLGSDMPNVARLSLNVACPKSSRRRALPRQRSLPKSGVGRRQCPKKQPGSSCNDRPDREPKLAK